MNIGSENYLRCQAIKLQLHEIFACDQTDKCKQKVESGRLEKLPDGLLQMSAGLYGRELFSKTWFSWFLWCSWLLEILVFIVFLNEGCSEMWSRGFRGSRGFHCEKRTTPTLNHPLWALQMFCPPPNSLRGRWDDSSQAVACWGLLEATMRSTRMGSEKSRSTGCTSRKPKN